MKPNLSHKPNKNIKPPKYDVLDKGGEVKVWEWWATLSPFALMFGFMLWYYWDKAGCIKCLTR